MKQITMSPYLSDLFENRQKNQKFEQYNQKWNNSSYQIDFNQHFKQKQMNFN